MPAALHPGCRSGATPYVARAILEHFEPACAGRQARRNARHSKKISQCLEACSTHGSGSRSVKPSAVNFPLQVHWIDGGHWIHCEHDTTADRRPPGLQCSSGGPISSGPGRLTVAARNKMNLRPYSRRSLYRIEHRVF